MPATDCLPCRIPGDRFCCNVCEAEEAAKWRADRTQPFPETIYRCFAHKVQHEQEVHDVEPKPQACTGCKKDLGIAPSKFSKAGAPWCGECPPWWFE